VRGKRVAAAQTARGATFEADRFVYNGDPKRLFELLGQAAPAWFRRKLTYDYSASNFTLYLGVRGLDLRRHGFGNWNVWHYPFDDVDRCYHEQVDLGRMEKPILFISTPTLHHRQARIAPDGCEQMVVCTACRYDYFKKLQQTGRSAYLAEKQRVAGLMLDVLEKHYVPGLRQHWTSSRPGRRRRTRSSSSRRRATPTARR